MSKFKPLTSPSFLASSIPIINPKYSNLQQQQHHEMNIKKEKEEGEGEENDSRPLNKHKKMIYLDSEYIKYIHVETKRFSNQLSQSDIECKPVVNMRLALSNKIIEICQMTTTHSSTSPVVLQARLNKIRNVVNILIKENSNTNDRNEQNAMKESEDEEEEDDEGDKKSFYDLCLMEACVQLCQLKPTLLTRGDDLIRFARRILKNCLIVEEKEEVEEEEETIKRSATPISTCSNFNANATFSSKEMNKTNNNNKPNKYKK